MVVYYDPVKGQTIDTAGSIAEQQGLQAPVGLDPIGRQRWEAEQEVKQANLQFEQGAKEGRNKPGFAQNPGQFFDDLGNILGDTATGLVTDYLDLGAGLADIAVQTGSALVGRGFDGDQVFDDSDNPWTQWRQQEFGAQTEAGAAVANLSRLASMVLTLPKIGIKGLAMAPRMLSKAPAVGEAFGAATSWLDKLDDAVKASRNVKVTDAMADLGKGFAKGSAASKATKIAATDDWLSATFKEVSQVGEAKTWWGSVQDSTKALTQLTREKARIRTVSEALAWDAFASFNVYGEGDWEMDETFTDMLASAGMPGLPWLQTSVQDAPLARKFKQMTEGLVMGGVMNAAFDMARVYRYSRAFAAADPEEQARIVKAFNGEAEEIGRSLGQNAAPGVGRKDGYFPSDFANPLPGPMRGPVDPSVDPWETGGALDRLNLGVATDRIKQDYQRDLVAAQAMAGAPGQMAGGMPQAMPRGMRPRLPGQAALGAGGDVVDQGIEEVNVQDLGAVAQQQPAMGGAQVVGALPSEVAPRSYAGAFPYPDNAPGGVQPGQVDLPIEQVQIDVGVRPPSATVTPQTIKRAFEFDARRAFQQMLETTYVDTTGGSMKSLAELSGKVKQLVPSNRVDAIEYIQRFMPQANELGVIAAPDSAWMNFITNRGLAEGWATIDPDTFEVKFNRKAAFEIDRGDVAAKQADAMDQLHELSRYEEWTGFQDPDIAESFKAAQQDLPVPIDQEQAARLADLEQNPARLDLERKAVTAGVEEDQMLASEELRLSQAELDQAVGKTDDATVVREYLGTTLDDIKAPEVQKAEVGRGWEVVGPDGEIIGSTSTKRAADKLAESERRRLVDSTVARARQMEQDGTDQAINMTIGDPIYDSDIVGRVTLTDRQIEAVQKYSEGIQRQMNADWIKRTNGQAFININELGGSKKTFELTQGEMMDLVDGVKALLQTGEITGARAKVLRNVADKLDTSMKLLAPQARAKRFADGIVADAQRFLEHGDFC